MFVLTIGDSNNKLHIGKYLPKLFYNCLGDNGGHRKVDFTSLPL